jgi:hypothetical protein
MSDRIKIRAGSKKIGDEINGRKITGLGKEWSERVTDETACCYGMEPGLDYYPQVRMQYAHIGKGVKNAL